MQRTLTGYRFCEGAPSTDLGDARTWGYDDFVTPPLCTDCALREVADPDEREQYACDGCGIVVGTGAALTRFRVELGHLEASFGSAIGAVMVGSRRTGLTVSATTSSMRRGINQQCRVLSLDEVG